MGNVGCLPIAKDGFVQQPVLTIRWGAASGWIRDATPQPRGGLRMIVSIVTFKLPRPWTVTEAAMVFKSTAPKYLDMPGLVRKHYYITESGDRAGGIYFWESKTAAEACYTREWKAMVTEKYGAPPDIVYAVVPVSVDNLEKLLEPA